MEQIGYIVPNTILSLEATQITDPVRIDTYIKNQFPLYSRNFFQQLIDDGKISLNGKTIHRQSTLVKTNDTIIVQFPPKRSLEPSDIKTALTDKKIDIEVLYKHKHFLVLNKPTNLLIHPTGSKNAEVTLVDWLLLHHENLDSVGDADRPGIVHRLDKDTSGILLVARTRYGHNLLSDNFKNRTIKKTYLAIVQGHPESPGTINIPIGRHPSNRKKMAPFRTADNIQPLSIKNNHHTVRKPTMVEHKGEKIRSSVTNYTVREYFDDCSLVEVNPVTGRTHQIRVHFTAIGHPLIGDLVYGQKSKLIKRQALHAHALSFTFENTDFTFSATIPDDLQQTITTLRKK